MNIIKICTFTILVVAPESCRSDASSINQLIVIGIEWKGPHPQIDGIHSVEAKHKL